MRVFTDSGGREWDVVAGRESWGAIFAIFIPRAGPDGSDPAGGPGIRQAPLDASGYGEATARLDAMSGDELRDLLERSVPKNTR